MTTSKRSSGGAAPPEIPAAEFKAKCLSLMEDVATHRRTYTVTKRGKAVARLVPVEERRTAFVGSLRGLLVRGEALAEPTGEAWDAESKRA